LTKLFVDDTQKSYFLNLASILLLKSLWEECQIINVWSWKKSSLKK
jgi:hypothetical protein